MPAAAPGNWWTRSRRAANDHDIATAARNWRAKRAPLACADVSASRFCEPGDIIVRLVHLLGPAPLLAMLMLGGCSNKYGAITPELQAGMMADLQAGKL